MREVIKMQKAQRGFKMKELSYIVNVNVFTYNYQIQTVYFEYSEFYCI